MVNYKRAESYILGIRACREMAGMIQDVYSDDLDQNLSCTTFIEHWFPNIWRLDDTITPIWEKCIELHFS